MDPITDPSAVDPNAEPGTPAPEPTPAPGEPLPGQPEPGTPDPSEPQPGEPNDGDKTVPLAALHEERNKRQELQAELDVLKQIAGDNVLFDINGRPVHNPQPVPGQPQQPGQPNPAAQELEQLWESDPRKAVQVEIMAAMTYRDQQEATVDAQILEASGKHADFSQYDSTVRQYIRALPLDQRAKPGVVDLAYYVVKGQNTGSAVEAAKAEMLRKIQAGENVQGLQPGTRPTPPPVKGTEMTDEQRAVAEQMGLTPEQYQSGQVSK
jgi:hypothetical protein